MIPDLLYLLSIPSIFALDACLAWHEMTEHIYRCSLDFHPCYMVSLGAGALVCGLWIGALQ